MSDQINQLLTDNSVQAFVLNTDKMGGPGIHWISCCKCNDNILFIIDSLGKRNPRPNDNLMFQQIKGAGFIPQFYDGKFQLQQSNLCGYFAILISKIISHYQIKETQQISEVVDELFGKTPDLGDIVTLTKYFNTKNVTQQQEQEQEQEQQEQGGGVIANLRQIIKNKWRNRRDLPPSEREIISQYGNALIKRIIVGRKPIQEYISQALNILNRVIHYKSPITHDKLFHLYLIIYTKQGVFKLEKNEDINLTKATKSDIGLPAELIDLKIHFSGSGLKLGDLIPNAVKRYGENRIYIYNAMSNNCQQFVLDILESNRIRLQSNQINWIKQDVSQLVPNWVQRLTQLLTGTKNVINQLVQGQGDIVD